MDQVGYEAVVAQCSVIRGDQVLEAGVQPLPWCDLVGVTSAGEQAHPHATGRCKVSERNQGGQADATANHERPCMARLKVKAAAEWSQHVDFGPDRLIHYPGRATANGIYQEGDPSLVGCDAAEAEGSAKQRIKLVGCAAQDVRELSGASAGGDLGGFVLTPPEPFGDARVAQDAGGFDPLASCAGVRGIRRLFAPRRRRAPRRKAAASARAVSSEVRHGRPRLGGGPAHVVPVLNRLAASGERVD